MAVLIALLDSKSLCGEVAGVTQGLGDLSGRRQSAVLKHGCGSAFKFGVGRW
jgi:hypothetical protein